MRVSCACGGAVGINVRATQRGKILRLLRGLDFVPTSALRSFAYQYNARIFELRRLGYVIEACRDNGRCGFKLIGFDGRKMLKNES